MNLKLLGGAGLAVMLLGYAAYAHHRKPTVSVIAPKYSPTEQKSFIDGVVPIPAKKPTKHSTRPVVSTPAPKVGRHCYSWQIIDKMLGGCE